jgi:hypothetical protein
VNWLVEFGADDETRTPSSTRLPTTLFNQDPAYKPMLGELARFSFLAAAIHQMTFTLLSSLPFAVGQPQDVGLIFLSSMATGVAEIGRQVRRGATAESKGLLAEDRGSCWAGLQPAFVIDIAGDQHKLQRALRRRICRWPRWSAPPC